MYEYVSHEQILQELQRVSDSDAFRNARALKQFLTYAVLESMAGRHASLHSDAIAVHVFDRDMASESNTDTLVHVTANLLRRTLDRYYEEDGRLNPLRLRMAMDSYAMRAEPAAHLKPVGSTGSYRFPILAIESFECLSDVAEHRDFCRGFLSELCMALAVSERFMLAPATHCADTNQKHIEQARAADRTTQADVLLGCNLRWADGRLRVFAQLVEAQTHCVTWIDTQELDWIPKDPLSMQIEVAAFITRGILQSEALCRRAQVTEQQSQAVEATAKRWIGSIA